MSLINRIVNGLEMMLSKALVHTFDDNNDIQLVKLSGLSGEVLDGVERLQNYGLSSVPDSDSEAIVAYLNGKRDHGVVIVCDNGASRPTKLESGEVVLYSSNGQTVLLDKDGKLVLTGADDVEINGNADYAVAYNDLKSAFDELRNDLNALINLFNAHNGHVPPGSAPATGAVPSTADMSGAQVSNVRLP